MEHTESIQDETLDQIQEPEPPYRRIEKEILGAKKAPRKSYKNAVTSLVAGTFALAFSVLAIIGIGRRIDDSRIAQEGQERVSVKSGDAFVEETYSQLVKSESDCIDFDDPVMLSGLSLDGSKLQVEALDPESLSPIDYFTLYQPGGNVFFMEPLKFQPGEVVDLSGMGLSDGADYLLCYGNEYSDRLRIVTQPGGDTEDGEGFSAIVEDDLLMTVVIRVD